MSFLSSLSVGDFLFGKLGVFSCTSIPGIKLLKRSKKVFDGFFFSPMTPPCESASLAEHFSGPCFSNSSYDLTEDFSQRF